MSLRYKIFLIIGGTIIVLFFVTFGVAANILNESFSALEKRELNENVNRINNALENRISDLAFRLNDWTQWDDSYAFIKGEYPDFPEINFNAEIYRTLGVNFVVITDEEKNIIYKQFYNNQGIEKPFPESLEKYFSPLEDFINFNEDSRARHEGLVIIPEGAVILVSKQVIPTSGIGQPLGSLSFGILIDDEYIAPLSEMTRLNMSYSIYTDKNIKEDFETARKNLNKENQIFLANTENNDKITGYFLVKDIYNEPAIILKTEMERTIYKNGQKSIAIFQILAFLIGAVLFLIVFLLIELLVLKKIRQMNHEAGKIGKSKNLDSRLTIFGKDEFARLGRKINQMLDDLNASEVRKKELEKAKAELNEEINKRNRELHEKIAELEKMNEFMTGRELKMIELKEKIKKLEKTIQE